MRRVQTKTEKADRAEWGGRGFCALAVRKWCLRADVVRKFTTGDSKSKSVQFKDLTGQRGRLSSVAAYCDMGPDAERNGPNEAGHIVQDEAHAFWWVGNMNG